MKKKKNFTFLTPMISIGIIEVFKATVGFFTWITLKGWWEKYRAKKAKNEPKKNCSNR